MSAACTSACPFFVMVDLASALVEIYRLIRVDESHLSQLLPAQSPKHDPSSFIWSVPAAQINLLLPVETGRVVLAELVLCPVYIVGDISSKKEKVKKNGQELRYEVA